MDDGVILSEAEFDNLSKQNVERWVSAHIIPVWVSFTQRCGCQELTRARSKDFSSLLVVRGRL